MFDKIKTYLARLNWVAHWWYSDWSNCFHAKHNVLKLSFAKF